jgi:CIC family chloride channel protein
MPGTGGSHAGPLSCHPVPTGLVQLRILITRLLARLGIGEGALLVPLAAVIGVVTAAAAVGFHELIVFIRDHLYRLERYGLGTDFLYGHGLFLLVLLPALGGLAVGVFSTYLMRAREGHGIVDVLETVTRGGGGNIRLLVALEKILTSAVTIGSGGSAGAEGPIVQIGAAIASGVGRLFQVARPHFPVLVGCGSAAGISAIFNSPIGGVLFTLEVILLDFSVRAFTPIVVASVIANVATQGIFHHLDPHASQYSIFVLPSWVTDHALRLTWGGVANFALLGAVCGLVGATLTRLMYRAEDAFGRLNVPRALKPALGGAAVGALGVLYVLLFGWGLLGRAKPVGLSYYPMPAFYGDGYGVVQRLLDGNFYGQFTTFGDVVLLLAFLVLAKIAATVLTLGSGGSGGVIAPSLFLGATSGALVGLLLQEAGYAAGVEVPFYALIGMGAVLSAVVHAPLAAILILFDVSQTPATIVPAMLASVVAAGSARLIFPDSIYSLSLRRRGVRVGSGGDLALLRRLTVEQVELEPVVSVAASMSLERLLQLTAETGASDVVALNPDGTYAGMVSSDDMRTALWQREAIPLLTVGELARGEVPVVRSGDDLASVVATFAQYEVNRLPVCVAARPERVIGLVSRSALMRRYHRALTAGS